MDTFVAVVTGDYVADTLGIASEGRKVKEDHVLVDWCRMCSVLQDEKTAVSCAPFFASYCPSPAASAAFDEKSDRKYKDIVLQGVRYNDWQQVQKEKLMDRSL